MHSRNTLDEISSILLGLFLRTVTTNDITGYYENREYCLFRFENFGIRVDNRWNTYEISLSSIGITIEILTTR